MKNINFVTLAITRAMHRFAVIGAAAAILLIVPLSLNSIGNKLQHDGFSLDISLDYQAAWAQLEGCSTQQDPNQYCADIIDAILGSDVTANDVTCVDDICRVTCEAITVCSLLSIAAPEVFGSPLCCERSQEPNYCRVGELAPAPPGTTPTECADSLEDTDGDGVIDSEDNCPDDPNPDQTDTDMDGTGDVCDPTPHHDNCECLGGGNHGQYIACVVQGLQSDGTVSVPILKSAIAAQECGL